MREQIRLWFYSMLVHVGDAARVARRIARVLDLREAARRDRPRDAQVDGATRSRRTRPSTAWAPTSCAGMFCEQNPSQNLNFGYGPANEIKRRLLTLWNSVKFFVDYANVGGLVARGDRRARAARPLARVAGGAARRRDDRRLRAVLDARRHLVVRGLRRRPLELVHPPVAEALLEQRSGSASRRSGPRSSERSS